MKILDCSIIESQFAYCPLIWTFCSKYAEVEKVQYKVLQVEYNNYMVTCDELLTLNDKLKIHEKKLQFLAINPSFMWKTYKEKNTPYSLRRSISLFVPNA